MSKETPAGELLPNGIRHLMPMIRVACITLDGSTLTVPAKDVGQHIETLDDSLGATEGDEVTYTLTFKTMLVRDFDALGEFDGF